MDYYESAEGVTISAARAKREVARHGCSWAEFMEDHPEQVVSYDAQEVLGWLGY